MTTSTKPVKITKTQQILDFIASKGNAGARFGEIQRFICELNGYDYDKKRQEMVWDRNTNSSRPAMLREMRGYYCTRFFGSHSVAALLSAKYGVERVSRGRYRIMDNFVPKFAARINKPAYDDLNHELVNSIKEIIYNRDCGVVMDREVIVAVQKLCDRSAQPKVGTLDKATGLRYV